MQILMHFFEAKTALIRIMSKIGYFPRSKIRSNEVFFCIFAEDMKPTCDIG